MDLSAKNGQWESDLIRQFEWFHSHPELSYAERETTAKIRALLTKANIELMPYPLDTGLVAVIRGTKPGGARRTAALRCDIDALAIQEETHLPYASKNPGVMHACGHDFHITAGIGAAILLQNQRADFGGTVKVIFQPGEEESHGARKIIDAHVMCDVDRIWGFHADPSQETGVIAVGEGYVTAAVDHFIIRLHGVGCHGAHPDEGKDPIPAAAAIIQGLQTIVSRNINAFHPALLSVTRVQAGAAWNVISPDALLEGTVRTMEPKDRLLYETRVREIADKTAAAYGVSAQTEWIPGPPATHNDGRMAALCETIAKKTRQKTAPQAPSMGGDDFSYYEDPAAVGKEIPGCYFKIGTGVGPQIHHPAFCVDERAIRPAAEYLANLLLADMGSIGLVPAPLSR